MVLSKLVNLLKRGGEKQRVNLTPDQEIEAAEKALQAGELKQAAYHVGCALVSDPNRPEWLALLTKIADAGDNPLDLAPTADRNFVGTIAVRAFLLARLHRWSEALKLLGQVAATVPDAGYLQWAIDWLNAPEAAGQIDIDPIVRYCGTILDRIPELRADELASRETLDRIPLLIRTALATQEADDTDAVFGFVILLKRLGCYDLMRTIAEEQFAKHPDYNTANACAAAYRTRGERERAIDMCRQALTFRPNDIPARLDIGDLYLDDGRYVEAAGAYAEVLHLEPEHPWAAPSFYAAQALARTDGVARQRFDLYVEDNPSNARAGDLRVLFSPYFGNILPPPREAIVKAAEQILSNSRFQKPADVGPGMLELSALEAPSAVLACHRELERRLGRDVGIDLKVVPQISPDPRDPRVPVSFQLWKYDGVNPSPAVGPPSIEVASMVRDLAVSPYSALAWFTAGKQLGRRLGANCVYDLLGAMAHPTPAFGEYESWDWLLRAQYAACFAIAGIDDGWDGSRRRDALLSLVNGALDWTVGAAAVAIALIVRECPEAEPEMTSTLRDVAAHGRRLRGYVPYLVPVLLALLQMPSLNETERKQVESTITRICSE